MTVAGAGGVLGVLAHNGGGGKGLAGPAASRPRGRPFAAYVVSCVGMMTLPAGRLTDPSRCDSINRPDLNDDQAFNALSTKILTLPSRVERPPSDAIARLSAPGKGRYPVRLRGCRHHDCCGRRTRSSRASQPPPRRHYPPLLRSGTTRKPLATRAQRTRPTFKCTDAHRGRPRGRDGQPRKFPSPPPALATRQAQTHVAPRAGGPDGGQPRCARRNPKESPKARTRMRQGKSGANAPDRNRGRPPSGPPDRGATYEAAQRSPPQRPQQPPPRKRLHSDNGS
ncbi:hypothetical protein LMG1866_03008 [Achromobacter ruhlandii]|nr:hypothetical protein LMG1866_03008 [Achromobacter ruhlandii]